MFAKSKWKMLKKTSIGKPQKKKINHPVCQPPRNSTFSWKFPPPHRCARKLPTFSHLLDGSSQGKGALRAWQRRKWEHYESLSAILRPGIRCCFFTYPPTGFISRLLLGDKSVVYSLVEGPQHFWVPKHEEKGPCWGEDTLDIPYGKIFKCCNFPS